MIDFEIHDMTCDHCRAAIVRAILGVDRAAQVEVHMAQRRVLIKSEQTDSQRFSAAITVAGYTPVGSGVRGDSVVATPSGCSCSATGGSCGLRLAALGSATAPSKRPATRTTSSSPRMPANCCSTKSSSCCS